MLNSFPTNDPSGDPGESQPSSPRRARNSASRKGLDIHIMDSLKRHWPISLLVFVAVLIFGGFVLWKKDKPLYESHSVVYVSPKFPKILANDNEVDLPYDSYFADQSQRAIRHDVLEDALAKLPYSVRHRVGPVLPYEIQLLQRRLEVTRIGWSYEMSISLTGPSPNGLAEIVNAITETYVDKAKNEEFYGLDARLTTLREEQGRLQKQMDGRLAEQSQLMRQLGVATISSAEGATNPFDSTSQTVRTQLAVARMERQAAEARFKAVLNGDGSEGSAALDSAADDAISTDSGLSVIRNNLNTRRAGLLQEMNGMRPDHPVYQKDKQEITSIDGQLSDLKRNASLHVEEKLRQEVTRTRSVELQLMKELGQETLAATNAAPKVQRAAELGPEIVSLQKAYDAVDDRIRELELESSSPGSIHISTKALTPLGPEKSKLKFFLLVLMVLSLGCAIAAPVGIDSLDNKIYTPWDVEKVIGFHPLGVLVDNHQFCKEISDEYYFRLAAGVDHAVRSSGARTFLFTSPSHGSGTTSVVKKLEQELRRLNLRTRTITSGSDGLETIRGDVNSRSRYLLESRNKTDELQPSLPKSLATFYNFEKAGKHREDSSPASVVQTLHQAGELCDVVLIDAYPLPISAATEYLARLADATVVVVKSGMTTKRELDRAARLLERLEVAGVAVILNQVSLDRADPALKLELNRYAQSLRRRRSHGGGELFG